MMDKIVFDLLMSIVVAIIGIIARSLIPYLRAKRTEAIAKLRKTRFEWAADIIESVVKAVEQTVSEEIHGEDKKIIAKEQIGKIFSEIGLDISNEQLETLIEAAVKTMNENTIDLYTSELQTVE